MCVCVGGIGGEEEKRVELEIRIRLFVVISGRVNDVVLNVYSKLLLPETR